MIDLKAKSSIQVKKEDRLYAFECAQDATLGEVYDVLSEMTSYIIKRIQDSKPQEEEKKESEE